MPRERRAYATRAPNGSKQKDMATLRREHYTLERFLEPMSAPTQKMLRKAWAENDVLVVAALPTEALVPVLIMAGYAYAHELAIVDDWAELCERYEHAVATFGTVYHPDLWFASCIVINWRNNRVTCFDTYWELGIHRHWNELTGSPLEDTP